MAIVTIVGRPNVGKSSLFNRLTGTRKAIVDNMPGVTRDRLYAEVEEGDLHFYLVDTGGLLPDSGHPLDELVMRQVKVAIEESDVILFVLDGREGPIGVDRDIAMLLRKCGKPVIVAANKMDDPVHENELWTSMGLGFERVVGVSAEHRRNIEVLLEHIEALLPVDEIEKEDEALRVALIGRPNVGKSSILNFLAGEDRALVSDIPGTTRDTVDSLVNIGGTLLRLVDTAGLRKKSHVDSALEYYSTVRTYQAIDRAEICVLVMDALEIATEQDQRVAGQVLERGKGLVLLVNKWDLLPKNPKLGDEIRDRIREEFAFVPHAPLLFASALSGRGIEKLPSILLQVAENRKRRISTGKLNRLLKDLLAFEKMPSSRTGKALRISYCTQVSVAPPSFAFFVNDPKIIGTSFKRHVEKKLRELEDFSGSPLRIFWRAQDRKGQ
ncbi:MAG: ribosome biogenesis GTPase Der [Synergistales bacterium]|jgi:GTP-binding protein